MWRSFLWPLQLQDLQVQCLPRAFFVHSHFLQAQPFAAAFPHVQFLHAQFFPLAAAFLPHAQFLHAQFLPRAFLLQVQFLQAQPDFLSALQQSAFAEFSDFWASLRESPLAALSAQWEHFVFEAF
jgi:hypothetical protein